MSDNRSNISGKCYSKSIDTKDHDIFDDEIIRQIRDIVGLYRNKSDRLKIGFTCSTFDLLHPGHVIMLNDCKKQCDILIVGVQSNPTLDRPDTKNSPIQTFEERQMMVESCRYVDYTIKYSTENDLYNILMELKPDVRILGSDWKDKEYTGYDIPDIEIHWHDRSTHNYSTTNLRKRIYQMENIE